MKTSLRTLYVLTLAITSTLSATAVAQDADRNREQSPNRNQQADDSNHRIAGSKKDRKNSNDQASQDSRSRASQDYRVEPEGWVTVATDYNDDGFYDSVETIYYYDFKQAQDRSKQRNGQNSRQSSNSGDRRTSKAHVQGKITDLKSEERSDGAGDQLVAEVENQQGRSVCVCLGPKDQLAKLKLKKGDTITANGVVSRMEGKQVLLASKITANGESVTQKLSKRPSISRLQGKLKSLREAKSKRGDGTYLVGEVDSDDGTQRVHFGPKQQLSKLHLSEGDDVDVLTRNGNVGGKSATIAVQVSANDETVKIVREQRNNRDRSSHKRDRSDQ